MFHNACVLSLNVKLVINWLSVFICGEWDFGVPCSLLSSTAVLLLDLDASVRRIQYWLWHLNLKTKVYTHLSLPLTDFRTIPRSWFARWIYLTIDYTTHTADHRNQQRAITYTQETIFLHFISLIYLYSEQVYYTCVSTILVDLNLIVRTLYSCIVTFLLLCEVNSIKDMCIIGTL